jgi:Glyoxalase-like domain
MARRRYTLMIDCDSSGFRKGVRFWSEALGAPARHSGDPTDPFIELPAAAGDAHIELQRIGGPSRYHLDLFAPDVDREARRLEALGAQKVKREESWWVMQAPTGHLFCIIPDSAPVPDDDDDFEDEFEDEDFEDEGDFEEDDEDFDDEPPEPEPPKKYPRLRAVPND